MFLFGDILTMKIIKDKITAEAALKTLNGGFTSTKFFAIIYYTGIYKNISEKPLQKKSRKSLQDKPLQKTSLKLREQLLKQPIPFK